MRYTCSTCEERVIPVEGVTTVEQRGHLWHAPCLTVDHYEPGGGVVVAFPSGGKLIPETLMTEESDG